LRNFRAILPLSSATNSHLEQFHHHRPKINMMDPVSPRSSYPMTSDVAEANMSRREHESAAEHAIEVIGSVLDNADDFLAQLESNDMLGSAIVRRCEELADLIGNLAGEMEAQNDQERRIMAQACLQDAQAAAAADACSEHDSGAGPRQELTSLSEDEMVHAISGAQVLMRDVEAALRSIDRDEADEIASVALTVARLFILSLKSIQSTMTPEQLLGMGGTDTSSRSLEFSNRIEILDENYDVTLNVETQGLAEAPTAVAKGRRIDRVRALWPPLGPAVVSAAHWGKEEAAKKPLLAVALGLTLWPAAIITTLIGTPIVLADTVVQHVYNSFSGGPIIQTVERGAAQIFHAGRLSFLSSRLVIGRVVSRQVKRHGGVGQLAQNVGGALLERVTHPIETAGMLWDGVCVGAGVIFDGARVLQEAVERHRDSNSVVEVIQ
jgi:hypothetical protein